MKKSVLSLTIFLFCIDLFAQAVNLQYGPVNKTEKKDVNGIIGFDETGSYVLEYDDRTYGKGKYYVSHFNRKFSRTSQGQLEPAVANYHFEKALSVGNKLYCFYFIYDGPKTVLYSQSINKKTLRLNNDVKKIGELRHNIMFKGDFFFSISPDASKLMIVMKPPSVNLTDSVNFEVCVLDENLEAVCNQVVKSPDKDTVYSVYGYRSIVSNHGDAYILARAESNNSKGKAGYTSCRILSLTRNLTQKQIEIGKGIQIQYVAMAFSKDNGIVCSGVFVDSVKSGLSGVYQICLDKSLIPMSERWQEFPDDLFTRYTTAAEFKKQAKEGSNYQITLEPPVVRQDGGTYLIFEQYTYQYYTNYNSIGAGVPVKDYYRDIYVISLNKEGAIEWGERIPKHQSAFNGSGYSSFSLFVFNDEPFFFFNDHVLNLDKWSQGEIRSYSAGGKEDKLTMVKIDKNGKQNRWVFPDSEQYKLRMMPALCKKNSDNSLIIYSYKANCFQFSKLNFQ